LLSERKKKKKKKMSMTDYKIRLVSLETGKIICSVDSPKLSIGRSVKNQHVIKNKRVSGVHAEISFNAADGSCFVTDKSTNGTFINDGKYYI
jgi:pSer/pThr/pTyr-binding forkhead associated (FHA) protein